MATSMDIPEEAMLFDPLIQDSEEPVDYSSKDRAIVQEELEKKLQCRAERDSLIQRNILPAVSTSPIILAQTQQLQRAKTVDTLQQKLRDRVSRSELYKRNILPDIKGAVDPSLHAQQLQLQKKKLADNLNERIANRPGVLELVEGRILEPSNTSLAQAVKSFRSFTPQETPNSGLSLSLSNTKDDISPPVSQRDLKSSDSSSPAQSPGDPYSEVLSPQKSPPRLVSPPILTPTPPPAILSRSSKHQTGQIGKAPSPSQSRKKQQKPKYRKLRYHEYVPPTKSNSKGGKTAPSKPPKMDTPYALLLQQQQLFLQLQVLQQQYPNGVLASKLPDLLKNMPSALTEKAQAMLKPKTAGMESQKNTSCVTKTHEIPEDIKVYNPNGTGSITVRLDELKVNNLKAACKELNLIVSGKKVELIERLLDHNNGILPSTVLQDSSKDKKMSHTSSLDSNPSPESPVPSPVFQFPGNSKNLGLSSSSSSSFFQPKETRMDTTELPEVLPAADFQTQFDQIIAQQKVDYFSSKSQKTVAPRPDLKHMIAIKVPCTKTVTELPQSHGGTTSHSKSLPSSPQQLSPTSSTNSFLQDLMEQSPGLATTQTPTSDSLQVTSSSSHMLPPSFMTNSHMSSNGFGVLQQGRHGRASLPNPPPYPGRHTQFPQAPEHMSNSYLCPRAATINQRSFSLSGPSTNHLHASLSLDIPTTLLPQSKPMVPNTDNLLFPADEGIPANDLMDIDHDQLTDLLEIFDHSGQDLSLGPPLNQLSFDNNTRLQPRQGSIQSDSVMFGIPRQPGLHGTDLSLMGNSSRDVKPMIGSAYNEIGWMNLESNNSILSGSPSMHSYVPDMHTLGSIQPYEHFQLGLDDSGLKNSSGNITAFMTSTEMHPFLDSGTSSHSDLYGHDTSLLNLDLTS